MPVDPNIDISSQEQEDELRRSILSDYLRSTQEESDIPVISPEEQASRRADATSSDQIESGMSQILNAYSGTDAFAPPPSELARTNKEIGIELQDALRRRKEEKDKKTRSLDILKHLDKPMTEKQERELKLKERGLDIKEKGLNSYKKLGKVDYIVPSVGDDGKEVAKPVTPYPKEDGSIGFKDLSGNDVDPNLIENRTAYISRKGIELRDKKSSKIPLKQLQAKIGTDSVISQIDDIEKVIKNEENSPDAFEPGFMSGLWLKIKKIARQTDPKEGRLLTMTGENLADYIKEKSGLTVSDKEREFITENIMPDVMDKKETFLAKLGQLRDWLKKKRQIRDSWLERQGYKLDVVNKSPELTDKMNRETEMLDANTPILSGPASGQSSPNVGKRVRQSGKIYEFTGGDEKDQKNWKEVK